jgi:hypothetical protein
MSLLPEIFRSTDVFTHSYAQGLEQMLADEGLGTYILVLANAVYHDEVYQGLKAQLLSRYRDLMVTFSAGDNDQADDVRVFEQIMDAGLEALVATKRKRLGPWSMQYNRLRSFRPPRTSCQPVHTLRAAFNPDGFHFNRSFLQKEIWWQGSLLGRQSRLLYNKFPFAGYHGLLVIEPGMNRPQILDREIHEFVWQLAEQISQRLPGFGLGYNSYGAAASVNHQHFQTYLHSDRGYPVEDGHWEHHGGPDSYPLKCFKETSSASSWKIIESMHVSNTAYNLLYRPGMLYIMPRRFQGQFQQESWLTGVGWSDLAGEFTVIDYDIYKHLAPEQFEQQLAAAALPAMMRH